VKLRVAKKGRAIVAVIDFKAKETKPDWSETRGTWIRTVFRQPTGPKIDEILDPTVSTVHFKSKPAGFQLFGPMSDFLVFLDRLAEIAKAVTLFVNPLGAPTGFVGTPMQKKLYKTTRKGLAALEFGGNHVHVRAPNKGPVSVFAIVGDTGGPDISHDNNPKDDTRIQAIKFRPIKVRFK
jgi:hypothetical protein